MEEKKEKEEKGVEEEVTKKMRRKLKNYMIID